MSSIRRVWFVAASVAAACEAPQEPSPALTLAVASRVVGHANGAGVFNAGVLVAFSMTALLREDGSATGEAFHSTVLGGQLIEFRTRVTCAAIDPANSRAWIAGVVTENNSTHPSFTAARNQVGRGIWFRVVDYGNGGSGTVDRSTFVGFEGDAGIFTSAEYCARRIWPGPPTDPVDARTSPLTEGNISLQFE